MWTAGTEMTTRRVPPPEEEERRSPQKKDEKSSTGEMGVVKEQPCLNGRQGLGNERLIKKVITKDESRWQKELEKHPEELEKLKKTRPTVKTQVVTKDGEGKSSSPGFKTATLGRNYGEWTHQNPTRMDS